MNHGAFASSGTVLKGFRTRSALTQQALAEKLGVRRNTIGSWERGDFLPQSKGMVLAFQQFETIDMALCGTVALLSSSKQQNHFDAMRFHVKRTPLYNALRKTGSLENE